MSFQDAESKQELIQLRNSARGYKGALTRRINVAESHIETAGSDPLLMLLLIYSDQKITSKELYNV